MSLNVIDFGILIILAIGACKGYFKGLIGSCVGLVGGILALILANAYYKEFVGLLNEYLGVLDKFYNFMLDKMPLFIQNLTMPIDENGLYMFKTLVDKLMIPEWVKTQILTLANSLANTTEAIGISNVGEMMTYIICLMIINLLAFLLLWFLISKGVNLIASFLTNSMDSVIILGKVNRLSGLLVGALLYSLIIAVFVGMSTMVIDILPHFEDSKITVMADLSDKSMLVPYFKQGYKLLLSKFISFI